MDEQSQLDEPSQLSLPPVTARDVLCGLNPAEIALFRDLSAHPGLTYSILTFMPANQIVTTFHLS